MPLLRCLPDEVEVAYAKSANVLWTLFGEGVPVTHACGGNGRCSTCRVRILDGLDACGPRTPVEQRMAERLKFSDEIRLACQTDVTGDVQLRRLVLDEADLLLAEQSDDRAAEGVTGRERFVAVLFADIQGFTAMAEHLPAYDIVHLLNRFYTAAGEAIGAHGGHISNYMGDGLMALFGESGGTPPVNAVQAGLGLLDAATRVGEYFRDVYECGFAIRIGVHCGPAVVGDVGAAGARRETAIGDTVNFASRIEAANKETGTSFLVSDDVRRRAEDEARFGRRFELPIRGKTGSFVVHEILGARE